MPTVSIISPTYNHSKYIGKCIESVLSQDFQDWEMLIIDDGSTDDTYEIAGKYASTDHRIRVFTQENKGIFNLGANYNFALSMSNGKYIAILECDDFWEPGKLGVQVQAMESDPSIVLCWGRIHTVDGLSENILSSTQIDNNKIDFYNNRPIGSILNLLFYENCIPALTIVIRKDALLKIGGFKQNFNLPLVDLPTIFELSLIGQFRFIDKVLGSWRLYSTQITKTYPVEMVEGFYELRKQVWAKAINIISPDIFTLDIDKFDAAHERKMVMTNSRAGRYELLRKNYKMARKYYFRSLFYKGFHSFLWRIRSAVGIFMSYLHLDVEGLAQLFGKGRISKE